MTETLEMLWQILWGDPLYRALLVMIATELLLVGGLIGWMMVQSARQGRQGRRHARFLAAMEEEFFQALQAEDPQALDAWMQRARGYDPAFVRDFICDFLLHVGGEPHQRLVALYHEFGYATQDHAFLRSRRLDQRLRAMRRLYVVATSDDAPILRTQLDGVHLIHILALKTLARVGEPEDVVHALKLTRLSSQMMEEPVVAVLQQLDDAALGYVFTRWQSFDCARVRRLVLSAGARRGLKGVGDLLGAAARAEEMEVRIGACEAAGWLFDRDSLELLLGAMEDPDWQVRARAASALGQRGAPAAAGALEQALKDRAFWVRQSAGKALLELGAPGIRRLQHVARHCDDRYAAETAAQQLRRPTNHIPSALEAPPA